MRLHQSSSADACGHLTMPSITYRPNSQIAQRICILKSSGAISHGRKLLQKTDGIKPTQLQKKSCSWQAQGSRFKTAATGWNVVTCPGPCGRRVLVKTQQPRGPWAALGRPWGVQHPQGSLDPPSSSRQGKKEGTKKYCWKFLDKIEFNLLEVFCWQENRKHVSVLLLL